MNTINRWLFFHMPMWLSGLILEFAGYVLVEFEGVCRDCGEVHKVYSWEPVW